MTSTVFASYFRRARYPALPTHLAILHADRGAVGEEELDALDVVQLRREDRGAQRRLLALRTAGRDG